MRLPCLHDDPDCDGNFQPLCPGCQADWDGLREEYDRYEQERRNDLAMLEMYRMERLPCNICDFNLVHDSIYTTGGKVRSLAEMDALCEGLMRERLEKGLGGFVFGLPFERSPKQGPINLTQLKRRESAEGGGFLTP